MRKTKRGRGEEKKREEVGREGDCTSYLREECTRGHILHSTAVACPVFNSLSPSLSPPLQNTEDNITQHTLGATDDTQTYVIHYKTEWAGSRGRG